MYHRVSALLGVSLVVVAMLHITSVEIRGQVRSQLTSADVSPVIGIVSAEVVRSYEESTALSVARTFIDGSAALKAFQNIGTDTPETIDELGAGPHFQGARSPSTVCANMTECPTDNEALYLTIHDVAPGTEAPAKGEYLVSVGMQVGRMPRPSMTIGVSKSDGTWRVVSSSVNLQCICASLPCNC